MCYQREKSSVSKSASNKVLLTAFKKYNKVAREVRAKKLGFQSAAHYIEYLTNSVEPVVAPKKERKVEFKTTPVIHVVDVLDSSGSMSGSKNRAALSGINEGIKDLQLNKLAVIYTYTLCDFSSDILFPFIATDPNVVPRIDIGTRGQTALFDAIGTTVEKIEKHRNQADKVLVNIYTDGQENNSRKFNARTISELIKSYSEKGYTFTFIGTKDDVAYVNSSINIDKSNSLVYDGTAQDLSRGMQETRSARQVYTNSVIAGEDVSKGFYKNIKK